MRVSLVADIVDAWRSEAEPAHPSSCTGPASMLPFCWSLFPIIFPTHLLLLLANGLRDSGQPLPEQAPYRSPLAGSSAPGCSGLHLILVLPPRHFPRPVLQLELPLEQVLELLLIDLSGGVSSALAGAFRCANGLRA